MLLLLQLKYILVYLFVVGGWSGARGFKAASRAITAAISHDEQAFHRINYRADWFKS